MTLDAAVLWFEYLLLAILGVIGAGLMLVGGAILIVRWLFGVDWNGKEVP